MSKRSASVQRHTVVSLHFVYRIAISIIIITQIISLIESNRNRRKSRLFAQIADAFEIFATKYISKTRNRRNKICDLIMTV